jgi:hypothetical protein
MWWRRQDVMQIENGGSFYFELLGGDEDDENFRVEALSNPGAQRARAELENAAAHDVPFLISREIAVVVRGPAMTFGSRRGASRHRNLRGIQV